MQGHTKQSCLLQLIITYNSQQHEWAAHIVQDEANKQVQRDTEEVDDGGSYVLRDIMRPHCHHGRPEGAHWGLEEESKNSSMRMSLQIEEWSTVGRDRDAATDLMSVQLFWH
jgi:hypothetical protein